MNRPVLNWPAAVASRVEVAIATADAINVVVRNADVCRNCAVAGAAVKSATVLAAAITAV